MSEASGTGRPKPRLPELAFQACFEPPAMTLGDYRIACAVLRALGEPLPLGRPTRPTCIRALALSLAQVWPGEAAKAQAQLQQAFGFFARIEPEPSVLDLGAMPPGKLDEAAAEALANQVITTLYRFGGEPRRKVRRLSPALLLVVGGLYAQLSQSPQAASQERAWPHYAWALRQAFDQRGLGRSGQP